MLVYISVALLVIFLLIVGVISFNKNVRQLIFESILSGYREGYSKGYVKGYEFSKNSFLNSTAMSLGKLSGKVTRCIEPVELVEQSSKK